MDWLYFGIMYSDRLDLVSDDRFCLEKLLFSAPVQVLVLVIDTDIDIVLKKKYSYHHQ